ncbi:MAG: hypothetical protein P8Y40_03720 [Desulfobacterales bacterium]
MNLLKKIAKQLEKLAEQTRKLEEMEKRLDEATGTPTSPVTPAATEMVDQLESRLRRHQPG